MGSWERSIRSENYLYGSGGRHVGRPGEAGGRRLFIAKLPDRGRKILDYTEKVRLAIAEQNRQKKATDLLSAFKLQFQEVQCNLSENAKSTEGLKDKVTQVSPTVSKCEENSSHHANAKDTTLAHELDTSSLSASAKINEGARGNDSHTDDHSADAHSADALANTLKKISIKERGDEANKGSSETTSVYEKANSCMGTSEAKKSHYLDVIERRSLSLDQRRERFRTNRLPSDSNSSTPHHSPGDETLRLSVEQRKLYDRKHLDDITAARLPPLHHSPAQLLPLEESLALQIVQKNVYEDKQAKLAAQKLFEKLNIKMGPFNPEGNSYLKYRDHGDDDKFGAEE